MELKKEFIIHVLKCSKLILKLYVKLFFDYVTRNCNIQDSFYGIFMYVFLIQALGKKTMKDGALKKQKLLNIPIYFEMHCN